ncbi:MAG: hypothetical protein JWQ04_1952 [Pedosphaera sp.]|nr:hypothetical protein [Pedosphaera sp.]
MRQTYIVYSLVKLNWKCKRFAAASLLLLVVCAGCGGLNASHSVSPASFFLPGLMKADPQPPSSDAVPKAGPVKQFAQVQ